MEAMSSSTVEPADFLDLKLLPAWVREPAEARNYEHYTGEEEGRGPRGHSPRDKRDGGGKRRPANIQSADGRIRRGEHPRPIKRSKADCGRRRAGVSIVLTKPKIAFHKIGMLRSQDRRWKLRFVFCRTRRRSRM